MERHGAHPAVVVWSLRLSSRSSPPQLGSGVRVCYTVDPWDSWCERARGHVAKPSSLCNLLNWVLGPEKERLILLPTWEDILGQFLCVSITPTLIWGTLGYRARRLLPTISSHQHFAVWGPFGRPGNLTPGWRRVKSFSTGPLWM